MSGKPKNDEKPWSDLTMFQKLDRVAKCIQNFAVIFATIIFMAYFINADAARTIERFFNQDRHWFYLGVLSWNAGDKESNIVGSSFTAGGTIEEPVRIKVTQSGIVEKGQILTNTVSGVNGRLEAGVDFAITRVLSQNKCIYVLDSKKSIKEDVNIWVRGVVLSC